MEAAPPTNKNIITENEKNENNEETDGHQQADQITKLEFWKQLPICF